MNFFRPSGIQQVLRIPVASIAPNPAQPRHSFDDAGIASLAESIRENGLIQPVVVRRVNEGYELIAGERRLLAHMLLQRTEINALVLEATDRESAVLALTENLQRSDLSFFDEAEGIAALLSVWGLSREEAARKLGCAPSTLCNKLRLLRLPPDMRSEILSLGLSERHARALLRLPDDEARRRALSKVADSSFTVAETEKYIEALLRPPCSRPRPRSVLVVRDLRLFINTIEHAVRTMKSAGIHAASSVSESGNYLEYVIRVPRGEAYR